MFWTEIFIWGMVICIIMALYLLIKAGKLSDKFDDLKIELDDSSKMIKKLKKLKILLDREFEEKEETLRNDIKNLQERIQERNDMILKKNEAIVKRDEVITNMQKNSKKDYKKINNLKEEKEEFSQENIALKKDIRANYIELAKFTKLSEEKKELIKIQKKDIKEIKEYHEKNLDENNILIKNYKAQLSEVSWKINKIVTYVIEENQDENLEELLKEFDAFYIINACLIKYKRVNENQAMIHKKSRKHNQEREREHKRVKDRLRTISIKYNEPMDVKKCVRNKKKKK